MGRGESSTEAEPESASPSDIRGDFPAEAAVVPAPEPTPLLHPGDGVPDPLTRPEELRRAIAEFAAGTGPLAVDAERASGYRYGQRAYLVQLRRVGAGTALIDPIALPDLSELGAALRDTEWVLHAASQDLPCLAEVGMVPATLFDTELAGRLAGFERVGLGAIVERMLGLTLEKGHSAADWSTRPLPHDWLVYAALDVEVLVELRDTLAAELESQGKLGWATEEFASILAAPPAPPRQDPWRRTSGIHSVRNRRQMAAVRALWTARDTIARERDIAPGRVLPDSAIIAASRALPQSPQDLLALPVFGGKANRRLVRTWFSAIETARRLRDDELPPHHLPGDGPPPVNRWADRDPKAAARLAAVRAVMTSLSERWTIPTENLLVPDTLRRLAWSPPDDLDESSLAGWLRAQGGREWQIGLAAPLLSAAMMEAERGGTHIVTGE